MGHTSSPLVHSYPGVFESRFSSTERRWPPTWTSPSHHLRIASIATSAIPRSRSAKTGGKQPTQVEVITQFWVVHQWIRVNSAGRWREVATVCLECLPSHRRHHIAMTTTHWHTAGTWTTMHTTVMVCSVLKRKSTHLTMTRYSLTLTATVMSCRSRTSALDRQAHSATCPSRSTSSTHPSVPLPTPSSLSRSLACRTSFAYAVKASYWWWEKSNADHDLFCFSLLTKKALEAFQPLWLMDNLIHAISPLHLPLWKLFPVTPINVTNSVFPCCFLLKKPNWRNVEKKRNYQFD